MRRLASALALLLVVMTGMGFAEIQARRHWELQREKCARDFWEFAKYLETRDEAEGWIKPFPTDWNYLHKLHSEIEAHQITQVNKTRQLMVTWYNAARMLWRCHRAILWDDVYGGAMGSKREDDAVEVMARILFMYDRLPVWMMPKPQERSKMTLTFSDTVRVKCFPSGGSIGRTFTLTELFLDEFAYLPQAREMWRSFSPTLGKNSKAIMVSTPNGMFNLHADMWHDRKMKHARVELHWRDHPNRNEEWAESEKQSGKYPTEEDWNREQELSFVGFAGKRVYPTFTKKVHAEGPIMFVPDQDKVVYVGLDFGYHFPAALWVWKNNFDQYCVLRELRMADVDTETFFNRVLDINEAVFQGCAFRYFPDPAGAQPETIMRRSHVPGEKDQKSAMEVIIAVGRERGVVVQPEFHYANIQEGLDLVRRLLKPREGDGRARLIADPSCVTLIEGFQGGYHYPDVDVPGLLPEKDGKYDHIHDCLRYVVTNCERKPDSGRQEDEEIHVMSEVPLANVSMMPRRGGYGMAA